MRASIHAEAHKVRFGRWEFVKDGPVLGACFLHGLVITKVRQ